ncbi:MAG: hypothetical protein U0K68_00090 [Agathobacter sp.]|nr:hypothetical protein [Agathobacter sp.]
MDNRDSFIEKVPFYMTFPMQNLYVMEMEYERDIERMKALYPNEVSSILVEVEKRCDELEYEGSRIFDEEPDRTMLQMEIDGICRQLSEKKIYFDTITSLVSIIFVNEIYKRRCRHRRCCRWW